MTGRYERQTLLPQVGRVGQERLRDARVLLVGCGALGTVIAEHLVRAGVGLLRVVDRDVVEMTNLQRQVLFDEDDVKHATPKALAAALRLSKINSNVTVDPVPADAHSGNLEDLAGISVRHPRSAVRQSQSAIDKAFDLILDGTDNVATRYLINDLSIKHGVPWVYGAAVGTEGRAMLVQPGASACLRCIFPEPVNASELPTCDTAGVLATVSSMIASYQSTLAIQCLVGASVPQTLLTIDAWAGRFKQISLTNARRPDCVCCGLRRFDFLDAPASESAVTLCGRDAVQVRPAVGVLIDLDQAASKLARVGSVERTRFFLRCTLTETPPLQLTLFSDGRLLVQGLSDTARAKAIYARYVGS